MYSVADETRKPIFEGVQGENEARSIEFDITPWVEELGNGACTATAKRPTDTTPYPVTVTRSGNVVTWKPNSTDTAIEGLGAFQLSFSIDDVVAKTRIWNTKIAPSLVGAGDPPDPYDDWLQDLRDIAADALQDAQDADASAQDAEAWAKGTKNGVDVPSTDPTYENNAKYYAEQSLANQYGAYIVKSASGEIASFSDGADDVPMKSLKVAIVPKQSGSGDPSPSNVRPITGTSTANVFVTGINVWDEVWEVGGIGTNGADTGNVDRIRSKNYIPVASGTSYCIRANAGGGRVCYYDASKTFISVDDGITFAPPTVFTTPSNCKYVRFCTFANYGATYNNDISINYPATATAYEPYNGHTTPVPLGQTVYGGTVDVTTGVLTITESEIVHLKNLNWLSNSQGTQKIEIYTTSTNGVKANGVSNVISNMFKNRTALVEEAEYSIRGYAGNGYIAVGMPTSVVGDDDGAVAWLNEHDPIVVYELKTPATVQLTPAQVATLLGDNNVCADCGAVEVEYRADPTLAYAELQALILENL